MALITRRRRQPQISTWDDWVHPFEKFMEKAFTERLPEAIRGPVPPMNVSEDENAFTVSLELPGIDEADIHVEVMGNQLQIRGEKEFKEERKEKDFHQIESQYGSFSRSVTLPMSVKFDDIDATYRKGVLTVRVPKVEPTPTSKIKVRSE